MNKFVMIKNEMNKNFNFKVYLKIEFFNYTSIFINDISLNN